MTRDMQASLQNVDIVFETNLDNALLKPILGSNPENGSSIENSTNNLKPCSTWGYRVDYNQCFGNSHFANEKDAAYIN